jgi:hypothetical protein
LRRIGGASLEADGIELPGYFDPSYDCMMEVLRFDSRNLNPRYRAMSAELSRHLSSAVVYRPQPVAAPAAIAVPALEPVHAFAS